MSQLTIDLALDNYKSTLSQSYNWWAGSIYVNNVPSVSFPTGKKVLLTIEPEKANMQVVELDWWDSAAKTLNCTWATVKRGEWVNYSATDHSIGSEVKISIPYDARDDIKTAINSKVNTNSTDTDTWKFADATARDAYFTSPVNWNSAYLITEWYWTDYSWWSRQQRANGATPNASTTVAGKVEKATSGEVTAGTATGWTGAELFVWPAELKTVTDWLTTSINAKPSIASNSEAQTGTDTAKAVNSLQLKTYYWPAPTAGTELLVASLATEYNQNNTTYVQKFIGTIPRTWTYTVAFDMRWLNWWSGWAAYARIYKNGVAFGTEQTTSSATDVNKTENLTFTWWDTISLWLKAWFAWGTDYAYVNDFTVRCNQLRFTLA